MLSTIRSYLDLKNGDTSSVPDELLDDSDDELYDEDSDIVDEDGACEFNVLTPIMNIPPEILLHIASFTSKRSDPRRERGGLHPVANSDMSSLASTSRSIRAVLLPMLFNHVQVTSPKRLASLSQASIHIFRFIRHLSVLLDLDFYDRWVHGLDAFMGSTDLAGSLPALRATNSTDCTLPSTLSLVECLAQLLLRVRPTLQSLAFSMSAPRSSYSGSAWSQFPKAGMCGIPFSRPLAEAFEGGSLMSGSSTEPMVDCCRMDVFPLLTSLNIDGTSDVSHLLPLTPNLASLRLRIPEGFNAVECRSIVDSLHHVAKLEALEMWIWEFCTQAHPDGESKAVPELIGDVAGTVSGERVGDGSSDGLLLPKPPGVSLLEQIGASCPSLQMLNFQTRSFDYADGSMRLRPVSQSGFDYQDILPALSHFPKLIELHLPNSLFGRHERQLLNVNRRSGSYYSSSIMPGFSEPHSPLHQMDSAAPRTSHSHQSQLLNHSVGGTHSVQSLSRVLSETVSTPDMTAMEIFEMVHRRELLTSGQMITASLSAGGRLSRVSWVREEDERVVAEYEGIFSPSTRSPDPGTWTLAQVQLSNRQSRHSVDEYTAHLYDDEYYDYYIYDRHDNKPKPKSITLSHIYSMFSSSPSSNSTSGFFGNKFLSRFLSLASTKNKPNHSSTTPRTKRGRHHRHSSSSSTASYSKKTSRRLRRTSCSPPPEKRLMKPNDSALVPAVTTVKARNAVAFSRTIFRIVILLRLTAHVSIPGYVMYIIFKRLGMALAK